METCSQGCEVFLVILFKSYYVVWKHEMADMIIDEDEEFKSYYVVWKL